MVNGNRELKSTARSIQTESGLPYTEALEVAKLRTEHPVITIKEIDGVKLQLTVSDSTYPYRHEGIPVYAQIELPNGHVVMAFDYGQKGIFSFGQDDVTIESWVHPMWYPVIDGKHFQNEVSAEFLMTSEQFRHLEAAERFASQFSDEDMVKLNESTVESIQQMTSAQLLRHVQRIVTEQTR